MTKISKGQALDILFTSARYYNENLNNRNLLFVFMTKQKQIGYIETKFKGTHFLHLTGIVVKNPKISAQRFFDLCLDKRLSPHDFAIKKDGTTELKLSVMPQVFSKNIAGKMLGDFSSFRLKLQTEKLVGGIYAAYGFVREVHGSEDKVIYVPNTLLIGDVRDFIPTSFQILETYSKRVNDKGHKNQVYRASSKNIDWQKIQSNPIYQSLPIIRPPLDTTDILLAEDFIAPYNQKQIYLF